MDNKMINIISGVVLQNFVDVSVSKTSGKEFSKRYVSIMPDGANELFQFVVSWKCKDRPELIVGQRIAAKWTITQFGNDQKKWTTAEIVDYEIMSDQNQAIENQNVDPITGEVLPKQPEIPAGGVQESDFDFNDPLPSDGLPTNDKTIPF